MTEIRGDLRDVVDDIAEHVDVCNHLYPAECERTRMHADELIAFIRDQDTEVRRHLLAILRQAGRPYWYNDYVDLMKSARTFKHE